MSDVTTLLSIAGPSLGTTTVSRDHPLIMQAGDRATEWHALLSQRNGFFAFESALHVFALGDGDDPYDAARWNRPDVWTHTYGGLATGYLFFAEDIFGDQFCFHDQRIWRFTAETGEVELVAETLKAWAHHILADYDVATGYPLAHAWQAQHGPIATTDRLLPRIPFVLGGAFEIANLYTVDRIKGMTFRGYLAQQLQRFPDKAKISLKVV